MLNMTKDTSRIGKTADNLNKMAATFCERNKDYKDNSTQAAAIMKLIFPDGIPAMAEKEWEVFHNVITVIIKLSRFAKADFKHVDSIHDVGVYCAMIESILESDEEKSAGWEESSTEKTHIWAYVPDGRDQNENT